MYINNISNLDKQCTLLKIQLIPAPTIPTKDSAVMMIVMRTSSEDLCQTDQEFIDKILTQLTQLFIDIYLKESFKYVLQYLSGVWVT